MAKLDWFLSQLTAKKNSLHTFVPHCGTRKMFSNLILMISFGLSVVFSRGFRLTAIELGINAILGQKLGVRSLLHYLSGLNYTNHIGILDGGQAMGDYNTCSS